MSQAFSSPALSDDQDTNAAHKLYRHKKRRKWGLAILAWERGGRRGYQFEDGTLRVFRRGFYSLFEEIDKPEDAASELVDELNHRLSLSLEREQRRKRATPPSCTPDWSFRDQVLIFKRIFPGGFQNEGWLENKRGQGVRRALKRHRDPVIERAQELFARDRLDAMISDGHYTEVWQEAIELFENTTLVSRSHVKPLHRLERLQQRGFVIALRNLLHGSGLHAERFERFVSTIRSSTDSPPSWQLATAPSALFFPEEHVCVRPSTFRKQVAELSPSTRFANQPGSRTYHEMLALAGTVKKNLEEEGLKPADLLDIHDFLWETLRPSASKHLKD